MSKQKDGLYLYKYYKKRTDSFLANLNKAEINWDSEIIHKVRVEVKKIRALFHLYEMIKPKKFKESMHYEIFKNLFKNAGRIRELQINTNYINKCILPLPIVSSFIRYQGSGEKKLKNTFKMNIKNFNLKKLHSSEAIIVHLFKDIKKDNIIKKCKYFIIKELKKIKMLYNYDNSPDRFHKLRKHFRSLGEITDLLLNFEAEKKLKKLKKDLKSIENELGIWHDSIVFLEAVEKFLKLNERERSKFQQLKNLTPIVYNNTNRLLKKISLQINFKLNEISF